MRKSIFMLCTLGCFGFSSGAFASTPMADDYPEPITSSVTVSFSNSSIAFRPDVASSVILETARHASMVTVNGRTSTKRFSTRDEHLALARAVSARDWLVAHGVSPLKIMINYASAADFIADNATPEGRYQNQRVDIQMFFMPTF